MKEAKQKAWIWGLVAILVMSLFYLVIMLVSMPTREVWWNFSFSWYLIIPLILGFGLQIGLWIYLKNYPNKHASGAVPSSAGAVSGVAMLACCSHHLFDILPFVGLSGAGLFLAQYQRFFLLLGLTINIFGIAYMIYLLDKKQTQVDSY